jgi:hypothetical protein
MKKKDAEEIFRFHWEFMRRDPKYKEAFDRVMEIERQYYEGKEIDKGILFEEVKKTFQKFYLQIPWDPFSFPRLPDPDKSFDELTAHFSAMIYLGTSLSSGAITRHWFKDRGIPHDGLVLDIDFAKVNSLGALKQAVNAIIEDHWNSWYLPRHPERERKNKTDFEKILEIGVMKEEKRNIPWRELAEIVFPGEGGSASAINKTIQHHERYKELTEGGGWKKLKYP